MVAAPSLAFGCENRSDAFVAGAESIRKSRTALTVLHGDGAHHLGKHHRGARGARLAKGTRRHSEGCLSQMDRTALMALAGPCDHSPSEAMLEELEFELEALRKERIYGTTDQHGSDTVRARRLVVLSKLRHRPTYGPVAWASF